MGRNGLGRSAIQLRSGVDQNQLSLFYRRRLSGASDRGIAMGSEARLLSAGWMPLRGSWASSFQIAAAFRKAISGVYRGDVQLPICSHRTVQVPVRSGISPICLLTHGRED